MRHNSCPFRKDSAVNRKATFIAMCEVRRFSATLFFVSKLCFPVPVIGGVLSFKIIFVSTLPLYKPGKSIIGQVLLYTHGQLGQ